MKKKTNIKNKTEVFKWNVFMWDFNHDNLEQYDVVPVLMAEYNSLKKNERPKTKEEFDEFLSRESRYHFWAKCEYEMIVHGWPARKNDEKVDIYDQLQLNWDVFVNEFWKSLGNVDNADHRKLQYLKNRQRKDYVSSSVPISV